MEGTDLRYTVIYMNGFWYVCDNKNNVAIHAVEGNYSDTAARHRCETWAKDLNDNLKGN